MNKKKLVIFDFGNVLYRIDHNRSVEAFKSLAPDAGSAGKISLESVKDYTERLFECGSVSPAEFRNETRSRLGLTIDDNTFDHAWCQSLIGKIDGAEDLIAETSKKMYVALLSNTNAIHYNHFYGQCRDLFNLFDRCYFSHIIGCRKPEPEPYLYVLNDMKASPHNTLFIDDTAENIKSAAKLGINTFHISVVGDLSSLLHTVNIFSQ